MAATTNDVGFRKLEIKETKPVYRLPGNCVGNKSLLISLLVLLSLVLLLVIIIIILSTQAAQNRKVCLSPECVKVAGEMLNKHDPHVDPCSDFYEYACGAWIRKTSLDADQQRVTTMGTLKNEIMLALKLLAENPVAEDDGHIVRQVKYYYQSCTNLSQIEARGEAPMLGLISELGGWPVLDPTWDATTFDLEKILAQLQVLEKNALIGMMVYADPDNATDNVIRFYQGTLGMGKDTQHLRKGLLPGNSKLHAYLNATVSLATLLGAPEARARQEMTDMVLFEVEMAKMMYVEASAPADPEDQDSEEVSDIDVSEDNFTLSVDKKRLNVADLQAFLGDDFNLQRYLTMIFSNVSVTVNSSEQVRVLMDMKGMKSALTFVRSQPPRLLQNYLVWRMIVRMVSVMPERFKDILVAYNKEIFGSSTLPPRWETCIKHLHQMLAMAMGRLFVNSYFSEEAKQEAVVMIQKVQNGFIDSLKGLDWMDEDTREEAIDKAVGLMVIVGYPDYILDDRLLEEHYPGLELNPELAFENLLKLINSNAQRHLRTLHQVAYRDEWADAMAPSAVTAGYLRFKNQIAFPAAILQPPLFHQNYPKCVNYGSIGVVIGHEITHGFGSTGRRFDRDGNFRNWFSESSVENFDKTSKCFEEQFDAYVIPEIDMNVDGKLTVGENIADTGGLKLSLQAYETWRQKSGVEDQTLPGINLTHKQLFFLAFGQMWCDVTRPGYLMSSRTWDAHSPSRFRVIGTLTNSPDFAEAFSCPAGSKMNPRKKCSMW